MAAWLKDLAHKLGLLVKSNKVQTAVATGVATYIAGQRDTKIILAVIGSTLLLGQGAADFGKNAKVEPKPKEPTP